MTTKTKHGNEKKRKEYFSMNWMRCAKAKKNNTNWQGIPMCLKWCYERRNNIWQILITCQYEVRVHVCGKAHELQKKKSKIGF